MITKKSRNLRMTKPELWDNPEALELVEQEVERAVAPHVGKMTPERLEEMRDFIRDALLAHPSVSRFTALAVPAPVVQQSAALSKEPSTAPEADEAKATRGGDGG